MGISVFPAPAAGSKIMYRTTLLSGTSYTVPAGVTSLNVTLYGGGGGGGGGTTTAGVNGGYGLPGQVISSIVSTSPGATIAYSIGAGGGGGGAASAGGSAGTTTFTGATNALGGNPGGANNSAQGRAALQAATQYNGGGGGVSNNSVSGGAGGDGKIDIEYWV